VYLKYGKIQEDYDNKSINSSKSEKIQAATNEEEAISVHTAKYDDDTFEEESVGTLKSSLSGGGGSFVDGEACEESVPEIESDSDDDGLFFGSSSKNVSLDVPKFTAPSTVSTTSFNNNNNINNGKLTGPQKVVLSEHAHRKGSKPQAEINLCDSAPSRLTDVQQQELAAKSLVSLLDAPLLNNDNKKDLLFNDGSEDAKSKKQKKKSKKSLNNNKISAADIFGGDIDGSSKGKKKKKPNSNSSNNSSISAADIFGTKTTTSKKNKNSKKGKTAEQNNDMKMLMNAQNIFGKFDNSNNNNNNTKSKNVNNKKQNKDLNRDLNSILGNL